jgi:hypothetical protein
MEQVQSRSFRELLVAVSRHRSTLRVLDGKEVLPTGAELAKCERIVRSGWERVCSDYPNWRWMIQRVAIPLSVGVGDYQMPWYFDGRIRSAITYGDGGPCVLVREVHEDEIRIMRASQTASQGVPHSIGFYRDREGTTGASKERVMMSVFPTPGSSYTLQFLCDAQPNALWELEDRPFAGARFNRAIEEACLAQAEFDMLRARGPLEQSYQQSLATAVALDQESGPRIVGTLSDTTGEGFHSDLKGPFSTNGIQIYP